MARSLRSLIVLPFVLSLTAWAADPTPAATPGAVPPLRPGKAKKAAAAALAEATPSPEFENVRKAIDALTPEQRKRFQDNFWRWTNLSPDEKKALRDRQELQKKFMQQEVQAALQETGLQLDDARREEFVKRYAEERRKIEEQLRKETMEKRKPLVKELLGRLKTEFSSPAAQTTTEPTFAPAAADK